MADVTIAIDRRSLLMSVSLSVRSRRNETILHRAIEARGRGHGGLEQLKTFFAHFYFVVRRRELEGLRRLAARHPVNEKLRVRGVSLHLHSREYGFESREDGKFVTRIREHRVRPVFVARGAQDHLVRNA